VAITGSSGYLGGVIRRHLQSTGVKTVDLVRSPQGADSRQFRLDEVPASGLFDDVDLLIHCAYDMALRDRDEIWRVNVGGTERLLEAAVSSGVRRMIVLSSMSAYDGTQQLYGRAKLEIERIALENRACPIRPGLVYGPSAGGMIGTLRRLALLPVIPVVAAGATQFTVHEDDLADAVVALASADRLPELAVGIANPNPVPFRHVLEQLAWEADRQPRFVPVNWRILRAVLELAELVHLPLPVRSDSLLGLVRPAPYVPNLDVLDHLGVRMRRFGQPVPPS